MSRGARALTQVLQDRARALSSSGHTMGAIMRSGEFIFYLLSATMALTVVLQPRCLLAAALFVAITVIALAVALES